MKKNDFVIIGCLFLIFSSSTCQTFQQFIDEMNQLPLDQRPGAVERFLNFYPHSPITEADTLAHYYYIGDNQSISVAGDANGWNPENHMIRIEGTNLWYFTGIYEYNARLDYKFVIDNNDWIMDPRNPNSVSGGYGSNSELAMPSYIQPSEIEYHPLIAHGKIFDTIFFSSGLGNSRPVKVYTPSNFGNDKQEYPVILFHDGPDFIQLANIENILDYLIENKLIVPVIGVFVPAVNRSEEYHGYQMDIYADFIVSDLMAWVDSQYPTSANPNLRATAGVSDGGNISLWIGMNHPQSFGKIAVFSSNIISEISSTFQNEPVLDLKIYLDIGRYDIDVLVPMAQNFRKILESKGYKHQFYEWNEGHSWGNWRAHIDEALKFFFPAEH